MSNAYSAQSELPFNTGRYEMIEGITVCVNYADFLEHTLLANLHHFDHFVVVTAPHDRETQRLCQEHSVHCVVTDVMYEYGERFNKAMAINLGLAHLRGGGWFCHLDADVVLPDSFRLMLEKAGLEKHCIYGADRVNVRSYEAWEKIRSTPRRQFHHHFLVDVPPLPLGARLLHNEFGYAPIGYFQLWHSSMQRRYPINHGSAERTDVTFALQWSRRHRRLLPTVICYHLESEKARMGANWLGRTTRRFGKPDRSG